VSEQIRLIGEKKGRKRSLLVDARGVPLSLVASGANRHDVKLLPSTLDAIVVRCPDSVQPHLCADAGYKGQAAHDAIVACGYLPQVKQRREEVADLAAQRHPARRWVVERTHSWFNRFRKLLVSFEKTELSYVGLLSLAAALICWRQSISIYG
jgi:transposase